MIANPIQAIAARSISTGLSSLRGLRWLVSLICWADRLADCWVGQFAWSVCFSFLLGVVQDVWLVWKVDCAVFESMCQGSSIFHLSPLLLKRLSLAHVVIMHALHIHHSLPWIVWPCLSHLARLVHVASTPQSYHIDERIEYHALTDKEKEALRKKGT